ncbi:unnamed protein product [Paramecium sonneborni]|uniref:OTU domain-containing protein n=1 Tax=Paramecium sonneborni TaxID=65129 RepID=A0A8S1QL31_9CILI|nr:unnamed protein product [Paramecium sonneborni]
MGCCFRINANTSNNQFKVREECNQLINELYDKSWRQRNVDTQYQQFVRGIENKSELKKYYNLSLQSYSDLQKICNKFRQVRGDGNCFYTAFSFQYLYILLIKQNNQSQKIHQEQFKKFQDKYKNLAMKIFTNENFQIDDQQTQTLLLQEFFKRLQQLIDIKDEQKREEEFIKQFQNYEDNEEIDCCLYGLSIIFFRNLANQAVDENKFADLIPDRVNLLIWETECNNNEAVILALAKTLQIKLSLIFFQNNGFLLKQYEEQNENQIILLIKPGHYNIGIFQQENNN